MENEKETQEKTAEEWLAVIEGMYYDVFDYEAEAEYYADIKVIDEQLEKWGAEHGK